MIVSLVLMVVVGAPSLALNALTMFRAVKVSESTVNSAQNVESLQVPPGRLYNLRCSSTCGRMEWCQLWCRGTSPGHCILSDMFVMPGYVEPNMADALTCYTTRPIVESLSEKIGTDRIKVSNFFLAIYTHSTSNL